MKLGGASTLAIIHSHLQDILDVSNGAALSERADRKTMTAIAVGIPCCYDVR